MVTQDRYSRQADIVPSDKLASCRCAVIGVGAIGRQVALQLAAMGAPWLQLVDHDIVEETNIVTQGYAERDSGRLKVDATAADCERLHPGDWRIITAPKRYQRSVDYGNTLFCCVDSIDTRRLIFETRRGALFIDGRMSAESLRILTVHNEASATHYATTLFPASEAHVGACTAKATIYCANVAAGLMLAQFTKWLRRLPIESDVGLNLLTMELAIG